MKWNSTLYDKSQAFVSEYGSSLLSFVPPGDGQQILDLGCGTGDLTQKLGQISVNVLGIDGSDEMIVAARQKYPWLAFETMDACRLPWENRFDVVFSNAVFHWISDQARLLKGIRKALKSGGRLICEFGAAGNIGAIESAYSAVVPSYQSPFYFPTAETYAALLQEAGFVIEKIYDYDRPTPLPDGKAGLRNWMLQFFAGDLSSYDQARQARILESVEALCRPSCLTAPNGWPTTGGCG